MLSSLFTLKNYFSSLSLIDPSLGQRRLLFWGHLTTLVLALSACEKVTIFDEPKQPMTTLNEKVETVGVCAETSECPQWRCVQSECIDGQCVPTRDQTPTLSLESIPLDQPLVSVSMDGSLMVALTGEVSEEREYIQTLGRGDKILNWTLSAAALTSDSTATEQREYEKDSWLPENQWSPLLEKTSYIPSFDPEEDPTETREVLSMRAITLLKGKVWISAGETLRDLWWGEFGSAAQGGRYFRLAAPAQSITIYNQEGDVDSQDDTQEAWVSIYDKGLERLDLSEIIEGTEDESGNSVENNARFNTPGRAIAARVARSFIVVADGYAGLSLFAKRGDSNLGTLTPSRRLVTPPQELSTPGRTAHLDLIEDKIISAEFGLGVSVARVSAESGLQRERTVDLGGIVRWVHWIDPYTALAWVDGRGVLALDLLSDNEGLSIMSQRSIQQESDDSNIAEVWTASGSRYALLTPNGSLYHGVLSCAPQDQE